jgi:general secretion pathway protein A
MYLSHFGLSKKPFDISPNPEFLWLGEKHREGLAVLKYGLLENKGFLMITGEIGTGKTALIRAIHKEIKAKMIVVSIPDPGMELIDFYNILAAELNMGRSFDNKGEFLVHFKRFILNTAAAHRRLLLIIDESQRLTSALLEEIRLLSNIDLDGKVILNTFFVGQNEFKALLQKPENQAVRQRITVSYELNPLTEAEVHHYVAHRLNVAGAKKGIFTPEALKRIHHYSKGFPRLVNIICDHALMSCYARGGARIDAAIIDECGEELKVAIGTGPRKDPPAAAPPPETTAPAAGLRAAPVAAAERKSSWRGAAILAGLVLLLAGGWYFAGDRVSDQLARWGGSKELASTAGAGRPGPQEKQQPPASPAAPKAAAPAESPKPAAAPTAAEAPPKAPVESETAAAAQKGSAAEAAAVKPATTAAAAVPESASIPPAAPPVSAAPAAPPKPPAAPVPAASPRPETADAIRLKETVIFFTRNSTEIPIYALDTVAGIASLLKTFPEAWLVIEGHTDSAGDPGLNKIISEGRAASVKSFLESEGIDPKRLKAVGYGPDKPLESNNTPEGRTKNRRVVIRFMVEG